MDKSWCILRTAGRSTLRLAASLAADGYDVWTPSLTLIKRVPRCNARREVTLPLFSGFVFAGARHLWSLVDKSEDPRTRLDFSVFRFNDHYPTIPDWQLDPLRREEKRSVPREKVRAFGKGEEVRAPDGAFGGLNGIVIRGNAKKTMVLLSGHKRVEFFTFDLQPICAKGRLDTHLGYVAKAA